MGTLRQGLKKEKSYLLSIEGNIILYLLAKQFVYCCGNFISAKTVEIMRWDKRALASTVVFIIIILRFDVLLSYFQHLSDTNLLLSLLVADGFQFRSFLP